MPQQVTDDYLRRRVDRLAPAYNLVLLSGYRQYALHQATDDGSTNDLSGWLDARELNSFIDGFVEGLHQAQGN